MILIQLGIVLRRDLEDVNIGPLDEQWNHAVEVGQRLPDEVLDEMIFDPRALVVCIKAVECFSNKETYKECSSMPQIPSGFP